MFNKLSLAKRIQFSLVAVGTIVLFSSIIITYTDSKALSERLIAENLDDMAINYFDTLNTMMITGTMGNRKLMQDRLLSRDGIIEARMIRSQKVVELYGPGTPDQAAMNDFERSGLAGNKQTEIFEQDGKRVMSIVLPIVATEDYAGTNCLSCHMAEEGEMMGAVKLSYDMTELDNSILASAAKNAGVQVALIILGFVFIGYIFSKLVLWRLNTLRETLNYIEKNLDLNKEIEVLRDDELGAVGKALNSTIKTIRESYIFVAESAEKLFTAAQQVDKISELTTSSMQQNKVGTDSVVAAIAELDASANEVRQNTESASEKSDKANDKASQGLTLVTDAKHGIESLRDEVQSNTHKINELNQRTEEVGSVLEVINGIAEQTNLLALNAAIEAARAGEQGRGFAVVADEVRSLATRTRESIDTIQATIHRLQEDAQSSVTSMESVSHQANERAEAVSNVAQLLEEITKQISELDELNYQIANAAKQQNAAADEINNNIVEISKIADESTSDAVKEKKVSEQMLKMANELKTQIAKFKL